MVKYREILRLTALGVSRRNVACPCKQALDRLVPVIHPAYLSFLCVFPKKRNPWVRGLRKAPCDPGCGFFYLLPVLKGVSLKALGDNLGKLYRRDEAQRARCLPKCGEILDGVKVLG